jgi:hypothetical protein
MEQNSMKKTLGWALIAASVAMAAPAQEQVKKAEWYDTLKLKGDIRYRFEGIDKEGAAETRYRNRIRVRVGMEAKLADDIKAKVQFATGKDDPVSTNQTLGDGFSGKDVRLDLGYLTWAPADTGFQALAGKMPKPFITVSDLVWDGDLNPEGVAAKLAFKGDAAELMLNAGYLWLTERSSDTDSMLYTAQAAMKFKPADDTHLLVGVGAYVYDNLEGYGMLYDDSAFGNSTVDLNAALKDTPDYSPDLVFANEYTEIEGFAEFKFDIGVPVVLHGQYVVNTEADDQDTGYLAGFMLGKAKDVGSFSLGYNYRDLEKDAVVGTYADSDAGGGGTNIQGHKVYVAYQAMKSVQLAAAYFRNTIDPDGKNLDYDRWQLDAIVKF